MSQTATRTRLDEFADRPAAGPQGEAPGTLPMIIDAQSLAVLTRSELDAQMSASEHRPRSLQAFRASLTDLVTIDEEVARECHYVLPARKKSDGTEGDPIEGESIRFAEMALYSYRNCRAGSRIIEVNATEVVAQGVFIDTETNVVTTSESRRRITGRSGRRYSEDMIIMTCNAAGSIAKRNAILAGIPKALWIAAAVAARRKAVGASTSIEERRSRALAAFANNLKISEERVLNALGLVEVDQLDDDHLTKLYGMYTAIRDSMLNADDAFPKPVRQEHSELDQFAQSPRGGSEPRTGQPGDSGAAQAPSEAAAAGADAAPASAPELLALYSTAINKIMGAALDKKLLPDPEDRVANLDGPVKEIWMAQPLDTRFVLRALTLGIEVARGDTKEATARLKLTELVKELVAA